MAMKSRADKLKNLKMPSKPMAEEEVDMDLAMEEGLEGEEGELSEEDLELAEEMPEEAGMLEEYSDEELIDEMRKRGLMEAEEDEEMMAEEEMPEDEEELEL
jgi:hypothetical protein